METVSLNSVPDDIKRLVFDILDTPSWGSLRQVSRGLSGQSQGYMEIWKHTTNYAMNKFSDLICDIREMARGAKTYTEVVVRSQAMAEDAMDPGMVDDVWQEAYDFLYGRILDRAAGTIAYSQDCTLEGAGSEDFFRIWGLVEAEAF